LELNDSISQTTDLLSQKASTDGCLAIIKPDFIPEELLNMENFCQLRNLPLPKQHFSQPRDYDFDGTE